MTTEPRTSAATLDDIVSALRRGDLDRAQRALSEGPIDTDGMLRLAELNVRRQRWADAAWLFDHAGIDLPASVAFKRNLCRNMAALAEHRPEVCTLLANVRPTGDVVIAASATNHPTLAIRQSDGHMATLSEKNRPLIASEAALQQLRPALGKALPIGLAGIGDGYLLYRLAVEETKLFMTTQVPVFVVEPDLQIALHAMMIHDYAGPSGPIAQARFTWFLGADWPTRFRDAIARDFYLGTPKLTIGFYAAATAIRDELNAIGQEIVDYDTVVRDRVEAYYADYDPATLAQLVRPGAIRKPRVLLPTTRFSTVLQYSNRDTANAFEALGWEARELIEPSPAHRLYQTGIRREIDEFKPDLVLQIDHLRHEHNGMFPANLPFVCWAQDHLPNLVGDAGKHVGPNEFVLTDGVPTYVHDFQYPASQCIGLPKLTNVTRDCGAPAPHGTAELGLRDPGGRPVAPDDVIFVSNASRDPAAMLAEKLAEEMPPAFRTTHNEAARRIFEGINGPSPYTTYVRIRELVEEISRERGFSFNRDITRTIATWLYHPFCDAIYRQQALGWAADACRDLGFTLGLYGKGWEDHPTLSPHARGAIANGPALHELSRRSLVNLQVVPYLCLHQRLLDGLCAGGFFLVREHASDIAPQAMLDLLITHGAGDATTLPEAQSAIDASPDVRGVFASLLQDCRDCLCNSGVEDPIEYLQSLRQIGFLVPGKGVLPRFDEISFNSAASLRERLGHYVANPDARKDIAEMQRASVTERFTYVAGIRRVVETIADRLVAAGNAGKLAGCHGLTYSSTRGGPEKAELARGSGVPQPMAPAKSPINQQGSSTQAA